jgi:hypothetical protein
VIADSSILGSPGEFKAEHNEGEPEYVHVKPIVKEAAQSNLLLPATPHPQAWSDPNQQLSPSLSPFRHGNLAQRLQRCQCRRNLKI